MNKEIKLHSNNLLCEGFLGQLTDFFNLIKTDTTGHIDEIIHVFNQRFTLAHHIFFLFSVEDARNYPQEILPDIYCKFALNSCNVLLEAVKNQSIKALLFGIWGTIWHNNDIPAEQQRFATLKSQGYRAILELFNSKLALILLSDIGLYSGLRYLRLSISDIEQIKIFLLQFNGENQNDNLLLNNICSAFNMLIDIANHEMADTKLSSNIFKSTLPGILRHFCNISKKPYLSQLCQTTLIPKLKIYIDILSNHKNHDNGSLLTLALLEKCLVLSGLPVSIFEHQDSYLYSKYFFSTAYGIKKKTDRTTNKLSKYFIDKLSNFCDYFYREKCPIRIDFLINFFKLSRKLLLENSVNKKEFPPENYCLMALNNSVKIFLESDAQYYDLYKNLINYIRQTANSSSSDMMIYKELLLLFTQCTSMHFLNISSNICSNIPQGIFKDLVSDITSSTEPGGMALAHRTIVSIDKILSRTGRHSQREYRNLEDQVVWQHALEETDESNFAENSLIEPLESTIEMQLSEPAQINGHSIDFKTISVNELHELCRSSLINYEELFFGVHYKYSPEKTVSKVPVGLLNIKPNESKQHVRTAHQKTIRIKFQKISDIPYQQQYRGFSVDERPEYVVYRSNRPMASAKKTAIVVFAGRKEQALLPPPSDDSCIFIAMTQQEFDSIESFHKETLQSLGYHFVILRNLWGLNEHGYLDYLDNQSDSGKLTARRRVALLVAYDNGFESLIMLDDNIASVQAIIDERLQQIITTDRAWSVWLQRFLDESYDAQSVVTTVKTHNPNDDNADDDDRAKIGWKLIFVRTDILKQHFSREQLYFLLPLNLSASSEDAFFQLMIHIALQKAGAENLKPFLNFSEKKFHLCRARNTQSNACVRSGIMAQELVLTEKELAAAFYYLQQHFEAFQMTLIVFNNNIALNADIRAASNKYRQNFDIPSALRKQQLQQELTPLWTAPATATTFESLLAAIGNSEQLGLRPPQAACLHAISQQPAQTERLLVSVLPTGVGKTRIEAMVAYASQAIEPKNHTIIISPTRHLTQQLKDEFAIEQQKMASRGSYQVLSVYSGSRANSGASSLGFVLDNNSLEQSHSGTIFVFCKASFMELLKIAQDKKTERYNAAYNLLNRVKTIIFDEEHISFDKRIAEQLNALKKQHTLNSFSYLLGFTATSPAELDYQIEDFEEPVQESVAPRSIIYSYSDEAATQNGYIRPIHTASIRTSNISTLFNRMTFTDGTSLNEHIGIIVCQSQQQLNWVEQQIQNNRDLKLQCFSIYSNKPQVVTQEMQQPGYYQKNNEQLIAEFKAQQRGSVALVIDMLREGFNHPPCCYTINLKKKMSLTDRTQRGGRCRRKINEQDNQVALFIDAILTDFRQPKRPYNKRARNDTVIDDITEKAILDADMMDIDSQNMLLFQSQNSTDNNDTRQFKKLRLDTTADDELVAMDVVEGQQSSETPNRHRR